MKNFYAYLLFLVITILFISGNITAQSSLIGYWEGAIEGHGMKIDIKLHFGSESDSLRGTIDIPTQNAIGLPISNIKQSGNTIHFEQSLPGMQERMATFDAELKDNTISGSFVQSGIKGSFSAKKTVDPALSESVPYKQEEVSFKNRDISIAGTLTHPGTGIAPAVILITGSGQQNRNEEIFGFKIFKIIADYFTRNGLAVLRLDDRGIGGTTGDPTKSTTADFAADIQSAVNFLKARDDIDKSRIGLMGHSEGGFIAEMIAAQRNDISFIVLMSGPGIKGDSLIITQIYQSLKSSGASQEYINKQIAMQKKVYNAIRTDKGWDEVIAALKEPFEKSYDKLSDNMKKQLPPKDEYLSKSVEKSLAQAKSPWFRFFIDSDPAEYLEKIKCPVLILLGGKDTQVLAEENKDAAVKALQKGANKLYTVKIYPDANHLYQSAKTGSVQEYSTLPKEFIPGFLEFTINWIQNSIKEIKSK